MDYQELAQRVLELETRLNNTIQENIDLRATVDILHQDQGNLLNGIDNKTVRK